MHVNQHKHVQYVRHDGMWVPWTTTWMVEGLAFDDDSGKSFADHNLLVKVSKILDADIFSGVEPLSGWDDYGHVWSEVMYHIIGPESFRNKKIVGIADDCLNEDCRHFQGPCREGYVERVEFPHENYGGVWDPDDDTAIVNALRRVWVQIYRELTK